MQDILSQVNPSGFYGANSSFQFEQPEFLIAFDISAFKKDKAVVQSLLFYLLVNRLFFYNHNKKREGHYGKR